MRDAKRLADQDFSVDDVAMVRVISQYYSIPNSHRKVLDMSEAQRSGFVNAFVDDSLEQNSEKRSREDLSEVARRLMKGCEYHFDESVRRLSAISDIIPTHSKAQFLQQVRHLKEDEEMEDYQRALATIRQQWPEVERWMAWWERPNNASLIFKACRVMDSDLWESMPKTTNPEESRHFWLTRAIGTKLSVIEGLEGLASVGKFYTERLKAVKSMSCR